MKKFFIQSSQTHDGNEIAAMLENCGLTQVEDIESCDIIIYAGTPEETKKIATAIGCKHVYLNDLQQINYSACNRLIVHIPSHAQEDKNATDNQDSKQSNPDYKKLAEILVAETVSSLKFELPPEKIFLNSPVIADFLEPPFIKNKPQKITPKNVLTHYNKYKNIPRNVMYQRTRHK